MFALFHEERRDEALQSGFRRKNAGHAGSALEFLVEALESMVVRSLRRCALVRICVEGVISLGFHGFVDQEPEPLGERVLVVIQKELQNGVDNVSLILVGRIFVHLWSPESEARGA